jgi:uncharacterized membrane protein YedE/YeeE
MTNFTPVPALLGGIIIGLAASLFMLLNGRVAGISGIFAGALHPARGDFAWRATYVFGLVGGGIVTLLAFPSLAAKSTVFLPLPLVAAGGLLVGFGARLSNGCTSGHGVCGLARLSPRSIVATVTFMATAAITVFVARHVL